MNWCTCCRGERRDDSEDSWFILTSQREGGEDVLLTGWALVGQWRAEIRLPVGADVVVVVVVVIMQGVEQRGRGTLAPGSHRNGVSASDTDGRLPSLALLTHLISVRRALSWFCSCSLASCCSSSSLCSFFLPCSSRSISSSASSICRFKAFRRRFSFMDNQQRRSQKVKDKFKFINIKLRMNVWTSTWSFWSSKELCSSSPCIAISFTFLSSLRLASCRLARSLQHAGSVTSSSSFPSVCFRSVEVTV